MKTCIVSGSCGLVGSETVRFFVSKGYRVVGIDNDMRNYFFNTTTNSVRDELILDLKDRYVHSALDIRNIADIEPIFSQYATDIEAIIQCAAQPSHDWAAKEPITDFSVNALGTLNLLELTRLYCQEAVFIFTSTNKVYGDTPNKLPLVELDKRWEISEEHNYYKFGIDESMSIDQTQHSIFGASKVAADVMVQEYGRYFCMKTVVFRGGCLTGPNHSGAKLHGFLAYLMKCAITKNHYTILGYNGKQVRDNIHSTDLVNMFWNFYNAPRPGEVYNAGGGRYSNCSILEAIQYVEKKLDIRVKKTYIKTPRVGDHQWYISDISKFKNSYPKFKFKYNISKILDEIIDVEKNY
jgi:CDP-paratose 2-epimerase